MAYTELNPLASWTAADVFPTGDHVYLWSSHQEETKAPGDKEFPRVTCASQTWPLEPLDRGSSPGRRVSRGDTGKPCVNLPFLSVLSSGERGFHKPMRRKSWRQHPRVPFSVENQGYFQRLGCWERDERAFSKPFCFQICSGLSPGGPQPHLPAWTVMPAPSPWAAADAWPLPRERTLSNQTHFLWISQR